MAKPSDKTINIKVTEEEHSIIKRYCMRRGIKIVDIYKPITDQVIEMEKNMTKIEK